MGETTRPHYLVSVGLFPGLRSKKYHCCFNFHLNFYSELVTTNRRQSDRVQSGINRAFSVALQAIADDPSLEVNIRRSRDRRPRPQRSSTPPRGNRRRSRSNSSARRSARATRDQNSRRSSRTSGAASGRDSDEESLPPLEASAPDSSDADMVIPAPPNIILSYRDDTIRLAPVGSARASNPES